jgi:hypothetical protein
VYCASGRCAVAWHVRYDTRAAAQRGVSGFAAGVVAAAGPRSVGAESPKVSAADALAAAGGSSVCQQRPRRGPLAVAGRGREVVVVAGPYQRDGSGPGAGADCASALRWARRVAAQP